MNTSEVRVLERTVEHSDRLKERLAVGDQEFEAAAVRGADGDWQLSVLPAGTATRPKMRLRVTEVPGNDVELTALDLEATLLGAASSMADRL